MANLEHVEIIGKGAEVWNNWRKGNPKVIPDLSNFAFTYSFSNVPDLNGVDLSYANLSGSDIAGPDRDWPGETAPTFENSNFEYADLRNISMFRTFFSNANLRNANFSGANITSVGFKGADLSYADFSKAKLERVGFADAYLSQTNFEDATLIDVQIPNVKSWSPKTNEGTVASGIEVISRKDITASIDDLELASFLNLLLNSDKLRRLLNVVTEKVVLILGRFTDKRKELLDAIRSELRNREFVALVFDFEGPTRRDLTETISLFAHLSRFVVADITDAKSIPQELQAVVPNLPSVIFQPILQEDMKEYAMFEHFRRYEWVLPIFLYKNERHLISSLDNKIILPALTKSDELLKRRTKEN
jgi:uncharacterized protein YjbI with pentapeptide repeats